MEYDVDNDYSFKKDVWGLPYLPEGLKRVNGLYVLPNGKYLPCGAYLLQDGTTLIYEPRELSFFGRMLKRVRKEK